MIFINAVGMVSALGDTLEITRERLLSGVSPGMREETGWLNRNRPVWVGRTMQELPCLSGELTKYDCRNNRLLLFSCEQVREEINTAIARYGRDRVGVVLGTSTSGIAAGEEALDEYRRHGRFPAGFHYAQQEIGACAECLALHLGLPGPAYTISTACSSSARAFISAFHLIKSGICDAVLAGGVDTLCRLTLNGFDGLESLAKARCNPLSLNRDGINIGEGAALFLLSREVAEVALLGAGESSDAFHLSAPDPDGKGAESAMRMAMQMAGLSSQDIGYLNLHGTATKLNDLMESHAVARVLGQDVPCGSTKPLTGHALGAAGAIEAAICWLILTQTGRSLLPPHIWDEVLDPDLAPLRVVRRGEHLRSPVCMTNSFAFGGNNVSLIFGRNHG